MTSYRLKDQELMMLLHLCQTHSCIGYPLTGTLSTETAEKTVAGLEKKSILIRLDSETVAIEKGFEFLIGCVARPLLTLLPEDGSVIYLVPELSVMLKPDPCRRRSVILTPGAGLSALFTWAGASDPEGEISLKVLRRRGDEILLSVRGAEALCQNITELLKGEMEFGSGIGGGDFPRPGAEL